MYRLIAVPALLILFTDTPVKEFIPDADIGSWLIDGELSIGLKKFVIGLGGKYIQGENDTTWDIEAFFLPGGPNFGSESLAISGDYVVWDSGWMGVGGWPGIGLIDGPSEFWPGYWTIRGFVYYQVLD